MLSFAGSYQHRAKGVLVGRKGEVQNELPCEHAGSRGDDDVHSLHIEGHEMRSQ